MAAEEPKKKAKDWLPLESNPELMNKYMRNLGVESDYIFHDVYGVDEELLMMVPQPVLAVLLLFPISEASEKARADQAARLAEAKQAVPDKLYYTKQTVGNACGTIGLVHTVLNLREHLKLNPDKWFAQFYEKTKGMSPEERAIALEESDAIEEEHQQIAQDEAASSVVPEQVNLHFVALVAVDDVLYELDGRKTGPVPHGKTSRESLLKDAARVIKAEFMDRDPKEMRFNMISEYMEYIPCCD